MEWDEPWVRARRRRIALLVLAVVLGVVAVVALLVYDAQSRYARGVAALHARDYALAEAEFSRATLYVLPYRDASALADLARQELLVTSAEEEAVAARVEGADAALRKASAALESARAPTVLAALRSVSAEDLQAAARDDSGVASAAAALAHDVGAAAGQALKDFQWRRAETLAAALALVDPRSRAASELVDRAKRGRALSARLAEARAAADRGEWRKALRLALAVAAAHKGFPGVASVVAEARKALKPKPKVTTPATTTATSTSTGGTSSGTSSGSSSGSSSQPAPP
jgi:hypothetical protein